METPVDIVPILRKMVQELPELSAEGMAVGFAANEIERLRLTDAEREAIQVCIEDIRFEDVRATLRGLLERTTL